MTISLIAAMTDNRVIGRDNTIPWDLPADRQRFRMLTWGHPVVMGRKTYESLPRTLDGRTVIVLSHNRNLSVQDGIVAGTLAEALAVAGTLPGNDEVFIAGGGDVYREALVVADRIYLTVIHRDMTGDATFPELPEGRFVERYREEVPGILPATLVLLERVTRPAEQPEV